MFYTAFEDIRGNFFVSAGFAAWGDVEDFYKHELATNFLVQRMLAEVEYPGKFLVCTLYEDMTEEQRENIHMMRCSGYGIIYIED